MPWENVGSCGDGEFPADRDWIIHCYDMAISYLGFILGEPPDGCDLGVLWHEHELGAYPSVGVNWGSPLTDPPWIYISRCESLLEAFDNAIDWSGIEPETVDELIAEYDEDEMPESPASDSQEMNEALVEIEDEEFEAPEQITKPSGERKKRGRLIMSPKEVKEFRERGDRMAEGMAASINKRAKEKYVACSGTETPG